LSSGGLNGSQPRSSAIARTRSAAGRPVLEHAQQSSRGLAREQRSALRGDAGVVQDGLEVGEPRVRAAKQGDLLERAAGAPNRLDEARRLRPLAWGRA
jgi:hypothetical protein